MSTGAAAFHEWTGSAGEFHGRDLPTPAPGSLDVWAVNPTEATIVAGSTQRHALDEARAEAAGLATARRRSGGGVVVVEPVHTVWIDVVVARGDERVSDDVGRSFDWIGGVLAAAMRSGGVEVAAHRGTGTWDPLGRLVCFAGVGPGESLDPQGRKVVGLSQRRTREQVRFQTVAYRQVPVEATLAALRDDQFPGDQFSGGRAAAVAELARRTAPLGTDRAVRWWQHHVADALVQASAVMT